MTALQTLKAIKQSGKSLLEWRNEMPLFPQTLVNVRVADKHGISQHEDVQQAVLEVEQKLAGLGRVNLRPSGTESLVRVMIEGPSESLIKELAESVASVIRRVGGAS
jgi:phosphoglucosamine mutase